MSAAIPPFFLLIFNRSLQQPALRKQATRGLLALPDLFCYALPSFGSSVYHGTIHKSASNCGYLVCQASALAFLASFQELAYMGWCYSSIPPSQHCCWSYLLLSAQGNCQKMKFRLFLPKGRKNKGFSRKPCLLHGAIADSSKSPDQTAVLIK